LGHRKDFVFLCSGKWAITGRFGAEWEKDLTFNLLGSLYLLEKKGRAQAKAGRALGSNPSCL
jgi:hypothetical protein